MRSFTRRAGSTSITSTNCQGIPRSLKRRDSRSRMARGRTPLKTRRKAPRSPTSTSATRSRWAAPFPSPLEIDIVDADHFAAMDIDNLAIDEVLLQIEVVPLVFQRNCSAPDERSSSVPAGVSIKSCEGTIERPVRVLSTRPATWPASGPVATAMSFSLSAQAGPAHRSQACQAAPSG